MKLTTSDDDGSLDSQMCLEGGEKKNKKEEAGAEKNYGAPLNREYNTMPRIMENDEIALPFSCAFVIKRCEDFRATECSLKCKLTLLVRIKLTGIENMEGVMGFIEGDKFRCRVNEEESELAVEG